MTIAQPREFGEEKSYCFIHFVEYIVCNPSQYKAEYIEALFRLDKHWKKKGKEGIEQHL